jgi:hypothetical protein
VQNCRPHSTCTLPLFALRRSQAQRPVRAIGEGGLGGLPPTRAVQNACTPEMAKPSAAAMLSAAQKGGGRESPDYGTTQHAYAQNKAKRSGQAERSGEGGFGGLPLLRQSNSHVRRRRPSRAQRPGRALRRRGIRGYLPTTAVQYARTPELGHIKINIQS